MPRTDAQRWRGWRTSPSGRTIKFDDDGEAMPVAPVITRRVEPGWRGLKLKRPAECACGCGEQIPLGSRVLWHRERGLVVKLDHTKPKHP